MIYTIQVAVVGIREVEEAATRVEEVEEDIKGAEVVADTKHFTSQGPRPCHLSHLSCMRRNALVFCLSPF